MLNKDLNNEEREMYRFLSDDPVPQLSKIEVEILTQRVLARAKKPRRLRWFDIRPVFQVGFAVAMVLVIALGITVFSPGIGGPVLVELEPEEIALEGDARELLVEAIESGELSETETLKQLMNIDNSTAEEVYRLYAPDKINEQVDMLTEEEAAKVLRVMDELNYPDKEEV